MTDLQKRIERALKKKKFIDIIDCDGVDTIRQVGEKIANEFMSILNYQDIPFVINGTYRVDIEEDGVYVRIFFDEESVHRDSWYPEKYPDGMDIVIAFNNGYTAKNFVYQRGGNRIFTSGVGYHTPKSLSHRDGQKFIQKACEDFNTNYKSVNRYATWNEDLYGD